MKFKGRVEKGFGRGGKTLGCPTANLDTVIPDTVQRGVWVGTASLNGVRYSMVSNVGISPYYNKKTKRVILEVHLLDYDGPDFYGETLDVKLYCHMRNERADFTSEQELKDQIQLDIENARNILK